MIVVLCADPLDRRSPDWDYRAEADAATAQGFRTALIDFEALVGGDAAGAVRRVPHAAPPDVALYRGWMLRPADYARLYDALLSRGLRLVNDPAAYQQCHWLPEWYALAEGRTPRSAWTRVDASVTDDAIVALAHQFGGAPIIVKDWVKSRKHDWTEACFIPSAADDAAVVRVVRTFLARQGVDLNEGLVLRQFEPFAALATHGKSGMPLTREFRVFWGDGEPFSWVPYWDEGEYGDVVPPLDAWRDLAARVRSRFFTMDLAQREDGAWMLVELGDGQVSGLPENADVGAFYAALRERWSRMNVIARAEGTQAPR